MPKDKAKSRRRQCHNSNDGEENISRKERDWLQAHLPEQKKSSWRTVYFPHEGKYIGHVNARGQRHGEGFLLGEKGMCYEGTWEDGLMSGVGVKQFPSGDRYEGNHIAGQRSGWGYYLFQCGDKYTGQWVANVMEGQGCFVWAGGDMYSGSWKKGVISGRGHKTYADGSNVKGRFHSGVPHGWCVKTLADGDVYTGCLVRGRRQGFGQYQWFGGGDVYTGMWVDDRMHGAGELILGASRGGGRGSGSKPNLGEVLQYRGDFYEATRQGYGEGIFASGVRFLGHWKADAPHGWGTMVYPNGDIGEGEFVEGVLTGSGLMVFRSHDHDHMPPPHPNPHPYPHPPLAQPITEGEDPGAGAPVSPTMTDRLESSTASFFLLSCLSSITPLPLLEQLVHTAPLARRPPSTHIPRSLALSPQQNTSWPLPPSQVPLCDDLYRGAWRHNIPHGRGAIDYSSGNIFLGEFSGGVREGAGVLLRKQNKTVRELLAEGLDEDFGDLLVGGRENEPTGDLAVLLSHEAFRVVGSGVGGGSSGCVDASAIAMQNSQYFSAIEQCLAWRWERISEHVTGEEERVVKGLGGVKAPLPSSSSSTAVRSCTALPSYDIIRGVWKEDRLKELLPETHGQS